MSTQPARARRLSEDDVHQIKTANPIINVVEQHVTMKRSGKSYKGLCPFHDERTPSFVVNPDTGTFKCFGCQLGGDVIDFVRQIEGGESFVFAARLLAERAGITIQGATDQDVEERNVRARLYEANEAAVDFYTRSLQQDPNAQPARDFLTERHFTAEHAAHFECGYAPREDSALVNFLRDNGFTEDEVVTAGLASRTRSGRLVDYHNGRLLWTIRNELNKPIAFAGRRLFEDDWKQGKFINTPDTPIYNKSEVLFGYNLARKSIVKSGQVLVVEGYADVAALHAAGVTCAVAACGTAFTKEHLRMVRRSIGEAGELISGLDADESGQKAALRFYDMSHSTVRRLTVVTFDGKDAELMRRQNGDKALTEMVQQRKPLIGAVLLATLGQSPTESPEDKVVALEKVGPLLGHVPDPLIRGEYAAMIADRLSLRPGDVLSRVPGPESPSDSGRTTPPPERVPPAVRAEQDILCVLAQDEPAARQYLARCQNLFRTSAGRGIVVGIEQALGQPANRSWFSRVEQSVDPGVRGMLLDLVAVGIPVSAEKVGPYVQQSIERLLAIADETTSSDLRRLIDGGRDDEERAAALDALLAHARGQDGV